jgi:hypothetical protein
MQGRIGWWEEACAFRTAEQAAILRNCVAERDAARQALTISSVALVKEKVESNTSLSRFKLALIKKITSSHAESKSYLKLSNTLILLVIALKGVRTKIRIWLGFWGKMCIDYACCTQSFLYTPHAYCI